MATSGSTDYNVTRNEICEAALRMCGKLDPNTTAKSADIDTCSEYANELLSSLAAPALLGVQEFMIKRGYLFLGAQREYDLGPSGDHATASFTTVDTQAAANTGALKVVLPTGLTTAAGMFIGINNSASGIQWTSLSASASTSGTVQLAASLTSTVSVSARVFLYTDKISRPLKLMDRSVILKTLEGTDDEICHMEKKRYNRIYDKSDTGEPTRHHYERLLTNGRLYFNYTPTDFRDYVSFDMVRPLDDFDSMNDNPDFPPELILPFKRMLAAEIGVEYGVSEKRQRLLDTKASTALLTVRGLYRFSPRSTTPHG